jgi:hypothetical protein
MEKHQINEWRDKQGELLGAAIFLTSEEVQQLRESGAIEIELADTVE